MTYSDNIAVLIKGGAYGASKSRGDMAAHQKWKKRIIAATRAIPTVTGPCCVTLAFSLPADRFPRDHPYGTDLDNLANLVLDALNETIFPKKIGKDSCVVSLSVTKTKAPSPKEAGLSYWFAQFPVSFNFHSGRTGFRRA
jgi:Holliday junction resolvase RusA-like endonuclease